MSEPRPIGTEFTVRSYRRQVESSNAAPVLMELRYRVIGHVYLHDDSDELAEETQLVSMTPVVSYGTVKPSEYH